MRNVLAQNLPKTSHCIQRLFIEFSPCYTMQHIHSMTTHKKLVFEQSPFNVWKGRQILVKNIGISQPTIMDIWLVTSSRTNWRSISLQRQDISQRTSPCIMIKTRIQWQNPLQVVIWCLLTSFIFCKYIILCRRWHANDSYSLQYHFVCFSLSFYHHFGDSTHQCTLFCIPPSSSMQLLYYYTRTFNKSFAIVLVTLWCLWTTLSSHLWHKSISLDIRYIPYIPFDDKEDTLSPLYCKAGWPYDNCPWILLEHCPSASKVNKNRIFFPDVGEEGVCSVC